MNKTSCKTCYYFRECIIGMGGDCTPAICIHPNCFTSVTTQTEFGALVPRTKRRYDIIDMRSDGKCSRWAPFHYEKIKSWWIFKKLMKVKGTKISKEIK